MTARLSTPTVLTKDGQQVHKDEYLEARETLIAGFAAGVFPSRAGELAAGQRGLEFLAHPFYDEISTPCDEDFRIQAETQGDDACALVFERVHFAKLDPSPSRRRWRLGLMCALQPSWADLVSVAPNGGGCSLHFTLHLAHDPENAAMNHITSRQARRFASNTLGVLRASGVQAHLADGGALTDGLG